MYKTSTLQVRVLAAWEALPLAASFAGWLRCALFFAPLHQEPCVTAKPTAWRQLARSPVCFCALQLLLSIAGFVVAVSRLLHGSLCENPR